MSASELIYGLAGSPQAPPQLNCGEPYILMVSSDFASAQAAEIILGSEPYVVAYRDSGKAGLEALAARRPALVILSLMLSDMDGLEACRVIRDCCSCPILAVSPTSDEATLVAALDGGADGCLARPLRPDEFRAHVRALMRRAKMPETRDQIVQEDLVIDRPRRRVTLADTLVPLTRTEFDILLFLAMRADRVQPQEAILKGVWGPHHGEYIQTLRVHIGHIRRKLESDAARPRFVRTEPGIGYYFAGPRSTSN